MDRFDLFPDTTIVEHDILKIGGCNLMELADQFGTPLYLFDRATLDHAVTAYKGFLAEFYPGASSLSYASKAFLCLAIADWTQQHNLWLDCIGQSEIATAVSAGVPRERLLVHGVNRSMPDLESACNNAAVIVVDNMTELQHLVEISRSFSVPELWLRFQPGLAVKSHAYTQTGFAGSKFGMQEILILQAAHLCQKNGLSLNGLHFHLGSQLHDPTPLILAIKRTLDLAGKIGFSSGWTLSPGGGWGVAYHEDDLPQPNLAEYIHLVARTLIQYCKGLNLPLPRLHLEPGRSLVARAGVALYRVGAIKQAADRLWVLVDGGMADNPRPALYGARYTALPVRGPRRAFQEKVWFAGPYCESGDVLIEALPFPEVRSGDLIAIPVSGAYHLSMSSNYNGACRPAVLWLDRGQAQVIQARESVDDLLHRDHRLVKPAGTG